MWLFQVCFVTENTVFEIIRRRGTWTLSASCFYYPQQLVSFVDPEVGFKFCCFNFIFPWISPKTWARICFLQDTPWLLLQTHPDCFYHCRFILHFTRILSSSNIDFPSICCEDKSFARLKLKARWGYLFCNLSDVMVKLVRRQAVGRQLHCRKSRPE